MSAAEGLKGSWRMPAYSINCKGRLLDLSSPVVMGILNVTPDSFYDGGKFIEESAILEKAGELLKEGAAIIDIGGASSRPGSAFVPEDEELKRVLPAIRLIKEKFPEAIISVDTWRARVAKEAVAEGAEMVNDISAGLLDEDLLPTVAELDIPYILMHMKGIPTTMQEAPVYEDVVTEVLGFLQQKVRTIRELGIRDIIIDPGFGFGKSVDDNYRLLRALAAFQISGCPVMVGLSRKSMISKVLKISNINSLTGTTILNTIALLNGASILRVHDAGAARECIMLIEKLKENEGRLPGTILD